MPFLNFTGFELTGNLSVEPRRIGPQFKVSQLSKITNAATPFAYSMASDDTRIVVGAYASFKVFVYEYNGSTWSLSTTLVKSGRFGFKVAISGDWIAVTNTPSSGNGSVFMYRRIGGVWGTTDFQQIDVPVGVSGNGFASAISLDGSTLVVGHRQANNGIGGAHIYVFNGTTWVKQGNLLTLTGTTRAGINQNLGIEVSVSGDIVAVGGSGDTQGKGMGMAFVSKRSGSTWSVPTPIQPSTTWADGFGWSIKLRGNDLLIGAPYNGSVITGAPVTIPGRMFMYSVSGTPSLQKIFTVKTDKSELIQDTGMTVADFFGWSVDLSSDGNKIIVGSPNRDSNKGAIYVYEKFNNVWGASALPPGSKLISTPPVNNHRFGASAVFAQGGIMGGAYGGGTNINAIYWFK